MLNLNLICIVTLEESLIVEEGLDRKSGWDLDKVRCVLHFDDLGVTGNNG